MDPLIIYYLRQAESLSKNKIWLVGQGVKTLPSHGRIMGSIPVRAAIRKKQRSASSFFTSAPLYSAAF